MKHSYTNKYLAFLAGIVFSLTLKHLLDMASDRVSGESKVIMPVPSYYWWINLACCLGILLKFIYNHKVFEARLKDNEGRVERVESVAGSTWKVRIVMDLLCNVTFIVSAAVFVSLVPYLYSKDSQVAIWVAGVFFVMAASYVYPNFDFLYACRYDLRNRERLRSLAGWLSRLCRTRRAPWRLRGGYSMESVAERWWILNELNIGLLGCVVVYLFLRPRSPLVLSGIFWLYALVNVVIDLLYNQEFFFGARLDLRRHSWRDFGRIEAVFSKPLGSWVLNRIGILPKVLEIGCGTGTLAYALARKSREVIAFDRDCEKILVAERWGKGAKRCVPKFERLEFCHNKYTSGSFDVIVAMFVLHDLDYDAALTEIKRLLVPGGKLLVVDIFEKEPAQPARTASAIYARERSGWGKLDEDIFPGWLARYRWLRSVKRYYSQPQMKGHIRKAPTVVQDLPFYLDKLGSQFVVDECRDVTSRIYVARARKEATHPSPPSVATAIIAVA